MKKGQGAVEYIIILGVIILIALIVVASLGGLGIFDFSAQVQTRTTEISNLLSDVAFTYVLTENGSVQVAIKSTTNNRITAYNMTWYEQGETTPLCLVDFGSVVVRQNFVTASADCASLSGFGGEIFGYDCTLRYKDANNIERAVRGTCEGFYDEG